MDTLTLLHCIKYTLYFSKYLHTHIHRLSHPELWTKKNHPGFSKVYGNTSQAACCAIQGCCKQCMMMPWLHVRNKKIKWKLYCSVPIPLFCH